MQGQEVLISPVHLLGGFLCSLSLLTVVSTLYGSVVEAVEQVFPHSGKSSVVVFVCLFYSKHLLGHLKIF